jgi:flagella basal body P-ring formation protein FlgA
VNLTGHVLAGASQTVIHATVEATPDVVPAAKPVVRPLALRDRDRATDRIAAEIVNYLNAQGDAAAWQVEIKAINSDLRPLVELAGDAELVVKGGREPWTGSQAFSVQFETATGPVALPVVVEVSLPTMVLAASRTLQRGAIVQASDLQYQARRANDENMVAVELPEDAVGRQVTRSIPAGAVLAVSDLREPIVVRRGDAVTVYSRAPGIRVRTTARAKQDGGLGDLIEVESFHDRSKFFARVSGIQEVEIFARGATLAPPMAAAPIAGAVPEPAAAVGLESDSATPVTVTAKAKPIVWRRATEPRQRPVGE